MSARARPGRPAAVGLAAGALVAAACAHTPPAPPPELASAGDPRCPLPLVWPSPELAPRRVHIRNATADTLVVVIDRCFHYTTIADIPPGESDQPFLPRRLIAFPDGIRFHAYIQSQSRFVGSWHVAATPGPALELVLDTASSAKGDLFLFEPMDTDSLRAPTPRVAEDSEGENYLMLPEVADGGFLIWSCGEGRRWLSMSTAAKLPDSVAVQMRFDGSEWTAATPWEVLHAQTDAVVAPNGLVDDLTARVAAARTVNLRIDIPGQVRPNDRRGQPILTTYGFPTQEVAARLAELTCFRDLPRAAGG